MGKKNNGAGRRDGAPRGAGSGAPTRAGLGARPGARAPQKRRMFARNRAPARALASDALGVRARGRTTRHCASEMSSAPDSDEVHPVALSVYCTSWPSAPPASDTSATSHTAAAIARDVIAQPRPSARAAPSRASRASARGAAHYALVSFFEGTHAGSSGSSGCCFHRAALKPSLKPGLGRDAGCAELAGGFRAPTLYFQTERAYNRDARGDF
jgi:hypothetical protein